MIFIICFLDHIIQTKIEEKKLAHLSTGHLIKLKKEKIYIKCNSMQIL